MPYREKEIKKLYFTTAEVAARVGRKKNVIRKWCRFFEIWVKKNAAGQMMFTRRTLHKIRCIAYLSKDMTMQQVKDFTQEGWPTELELLTSIKEKKKRWKRERTTGAV